MLIKCKITWANQFSYCEACFVVLTHVPLICSVLIVSYVCTVVDSQNVEGEVLGLSVS